jgi:site-specific DNA-methyltransferase (adenine-specific)
VAVAFEDAGFDLRDSIAWLYGSGFPKSHDVSKAIQKASGVEAIGSKENENGHFYGSGQYNATPRQLFMPEPEGDAKKWAGWGTALKPAFEPVVVARKPLVGTVAENVLAWGVGGLNIDASRIAGEIQSVPQPNTKGGVFSGEQGRSDVMSDNTKGRWPANIILDEYTAGLLDEQSGVTKSPKAYLAEGYKDSSMFGVGGVNHDKEYGDTGGASRFFYVAKASKRDRNEGLEELPAVQSSKFAQDKWSKENMNFETAPRQNFHPTVKPTDLMRYLIKLVTPAGGIVLDPFTGSGSTGKAALLDGYQFVGIELTADYLPIIEGRLRWADQERRDQVEALEAEEKETLF